MISLKNVSKSYNDFSINIEQCVFEKGTLTCVYGKNGSGKTTLFKIIAGITNFERGHVYIDNMDIKKSSGWKKSISTFLGDEYLLDFLNKKEYLDFYINSYNKEYKEPLITDTFLNYLYQSLPKVKFIREYSKGNKAKLGILATLLSDTKIMIFDEPFANLDKETQVNLSNYLNKLKLNKTIVLATHHKEIISNYCDGFIEIEGEKLLFQSNRI